MSAETIDHNTINKWFWKQVELALKEADDPATVWIPHNVAKTNMQRQRENLLDRIRKPYKSGHNHEIMKFYCASNSA